MTCTYRSAYSLCIHIARDMNNEFFTFVSLNVYVRLSFKGSRMVSVSTPYDPHSWSLVGLILTQPNDSSIQKVYAGL